MCNASLSKWIMLSQISLQIRSKTLLAQQPQRVRRRTLEDDSSNARIVTCYSRVRVCTSSVGSATGAQRWWYSLVKLNESTGTHLPSQICHLLFCHSWTLARVLGLEGHGFFRGFFYAWECTMCFTAQSKVKYDSMPLKLFGTFILI